MPIFPKYRTLILPLIAAAMLFAPTLGAASEAFNLKGKTVTFIVPFGPGGGTDTLARLIKPFLEKHLPGNPTIVVLNQPGGGSVKGANKFDREAKPDGLTIMGVGASTLVPFALKDKKVKYDVVSWHPVMLFPRGTVIYANPKTTGVTGFGKDIVADIKALRKSKLKYGAKSPTSSELRGLLAFELLGIDVDTVFGLSTGKQRTAFLRGEINVNYDQTEPYGQKIKKYEKKGTVVPIMTFGISTPNGTIKRDPGQPNLPTVHEAYELVNGKKPSGPAYDAFMNFLHIGITAPQSFVLPKGTPEEIVKIYVEAAEKTNSDPVFAAKVAKQLSNLPRVFGKDAKALQKMATDIKPETREWMKGWIKAKFNIDI